MERLIDVDDLAAYLKRPRAWVHNNHKRLGIPSFKVGGGLRFKPSAVEKWLEACSSDLGDWR